MDFLNYVSEQAVILIPALYIIGAILKGTEKINDKYIPVILLPFGILGSVAFLGVNPQSIVQGILITGTTVYTNNLVKQLSKNE